MEGWRSFVGSVGVVDSHVFRKHFLLFLFLSAPQSAKRTADAGAPIERNPLV